MYKLHLVERYKFLKSFSQLLYTYRDIYPILRTVQRLNSLI